MSDLSEIEKLTLKLIKENGVIFESGAQFSIRCQYAQLENIVRNLHSENAELRRFIQSAVPEPNYCAASHRMTFCRGDDDGDCDYSGCPQLRDGEPRKSGRHCPYDACVECFKRSCDCLS